jgi:multisubunit Na+/H+ antiporter MnhB subunit
LAIAGFILSFFGGANIIGLILSIIAFRRAPREDRPRGLALAGIILSAAGIAILIVGFSIAGPLLVHAITVCNDLGHGNHHVNGVTYTCN